MKKFLLGVILGIIVDTAFCIYFHMIPPAYFFLFIAWSLITGQRLH